jgi:hypothetical protein
VEECERGATRFRSRPRHPLTSDVPHSELIGKPAHGFTPIATITFSSVFASFPPSQRTSTCPVCWGFSACTGVRIDWLCGGYGAKGPAFHGEYGVVRLPEFHHFDGRTLVLRDRVEQHGICAPRLGIVIRRRTSTVVQDAPESISSSKVRDKLRHAVLRPGGWPILSQIRRKGGAVASRTGRPLRTEWCIGRGGGDRICGTSHKSR